MSIRDLPRIALAQMHVRPGRPDLNVARIADLIGRARALGAEVVAFPEMCVPGYIVGDAWEVDTVVEDWAAYSDDVRRLGAGLTLLFGNVACLPGEIGQDGRLRKVNAVRVCHDGEWVARAGVPEGLPDGCQPKTLHPNYRFFDDERHFVSARLLATEQGRSVYDWCVPFEVPVASGTFRIGAQLCEDIWCQDYVWEGEILDTLGRYAQADADAVINLSASPWTWQKNDKRNRTVRDILARSPLPFLYANHVGAQNNGKDILVFDGDATVYEADGRIAARAPGWRESLVCVGGGEEPTVEMPTGEVPIDEQGATAPEVVAPPPSAMASTYEAVLQGLRHLDHIRGGEVRFLIGLSGGIDSSVVACLLERAVGAERVFSVNMPTRHNSRVTQDNARDLAQALGIDYLSLPIGDLYDGVSALVRGAVFPRSQGDYTRLVDENIQARIRGADVLAGLAARHDLLFTNNGNKTELALGYTTIYGDLNGAVAPIGDLYKVEVFDLAAYLNDVVYGREVIPLNLLDRTTVPSAELSAEQDVTRGKGDPLLYGYHCAVLRQLIEYRRHIADLAEWFLDGSLWQRLGQEGAGEQARAALGTPAAWVDDLAWIERQLRINYYKRIQAPPIIVLSKRAFGFDLRESQLPACPPRRWEELARKVRDLTAWPSA